MAGVRPVRRVPGGVRVVEGGPSAAPLPWSLRWTESRLWPFPAGYWPWPRRTLATIAVMATLAGAMMVGLAASPGSGLVVSASLAGCEGTMCSIDVSFGAIAGADNYTASIAGPDGAVVGGGAISPGGGSLTVAYVGPGMYTVTISAWAGPPEDENEPIASDTAAMSRNKASRTVPAAESGTDRGRSEPAERASDSASGVEPEPVPTGDPAAGGGARVAP